MAVIAGWRGGQVPTLKVASNVVVFRVFGADLSRLGSIAYTEGKDTIAATGTVIQPSGVFSLGMPIVGAWRGTNKFQVFKVAGAAIRFPVFGNSSNRVGTVAYTEAADIIAASGSVGQPTDHATAAWTEGKDTLAASGNAAQPTDHATVSWTEDGDTILIIQTARIWIPAPPLSGAWTTAANNSGIWTPATPTTTIWTDKS